MKSDLLQDAVVKNVLSGPASLWTDGNSVYLTKLQLRGLNGVQHKTYLENKPRRKKTNKDELITIIVKFKETEKYI